MTVSAMVLIVWVVFVVPGACLQSDTIQYWVHNSLFWGGNDRGNWCGSFLTSVVRYVVVSSAVNQRRERTEEADIMELFDIGVCVCVLESVSSACCCRVSLDDTDWMGCCWTWLSEWDDMDYTDTVLFMFWLCFVWAVTGQVA